MNDNEFQRLVKKNIVERTWKQLADDWLNSTPLFPPELSPPDPSLEEFLPLESLLVRVDASTSVEDEVTGLRQVMFHEAVYLLHKAVNVISAAEQHAHAGMLTWSLSSAYQGSFFAAKSVMRLLGVAPVSYRDKKNWIIDIFPEPKYIPSRERKIRVPEPYMQFFNTNTYMEQRHIWIILQRLLRVTKFGDTRLKSVAAAIATSSLGFNDFTKQRNTLHYRNTWFYDDLYRYDKDDSFGIVDAFSPDRLAFEDDKSDFTLVLSFFLLNLGIGLLESLSLLTPKLATVLDIIQRSLNAERHPLYYRLIQNLKS